MSQGIPRRRSGAAFVGIRDADDIRPRLGTAREDRLPLWKTAALVTAALCLLGLAMRAAAPAARRGAAASRAPPPDAGGPRCFQLSDTERVKLLAAQNKATHRDIATKSQGAAALFDLGLLQAWGFERVEAALNFRAALRHDPRCAMCYWGLAYAAGPYPNVQPGPDGAAFPVFSPSAAAEAEEHAAAAARLALRALSVAAPGPERDLAQREVQLTELMARRFAGAAAAVKGDAAAWYAQERAYAEAMESAAEAHVNDADVFALAAEAFMNLQPWDYYTAAGSLRPAASRAEALLRRALSLDASHPLALHLHIHISEAAAPTRAGAGGGDAAWAGRALGSADALVAAAPQQGHLLHMPSHIYLRVGDYSKAVAVNRAAYELDVARASHCIAPYLPEHNVNLLIYAASMGGQLHTAEAFARGVRSLRERVSGRWIAGGSEWASLPLLLARYGEWRKVLALTPPGRDSRGVTQLGGPEYAQVVYHFTRVLALAARAEAYTSRALAIDDKTAYDLAARGAAARQEEVTKEMALLRAAIAAVPAEPQTRPGRGVGMYASAYQALSRMHGAVAEARAALMLNQTAQALVLLDEAVAIEDGLGYMEPPRAHAPARQCLGTVLLRAGKLGEAADVYQKDLERHPNNGWSLLGLARATHAAAEAGSAGGGPGAAFEAAWRVAEVQIDSSCPALSRPYVFNP